MISVQSNFTTKNSSSVHSSPQYQITMISWLETFATHLASIMTRTINMEHIIPTPPSISFNHGGNSVISNHPSVLTSNSATTAANLCHSFVSTPHCGNGNDLSCSIQAADGGVSNVRGVKDVMSVSTNTTNLFQGERPSLPHIVVRKVVNLISLIW